MGLKQDLQRVGLLDHDSATLPFLTQHPPLPPSPHLRWPTVVGSPPSSGFWLLVNSSTCFLARVFLWRN
jgi:hypothetical protein